MSCEIGVCVRFSGTGAQEIYDEISFRVPDGNLFNHFVPRPVSYDKYDTTCYTSGVDNPYADEDEDDYYGTKTLLCVGTTIVNTGRNCTDCIEVDEKFFEAFRLEEERQKECGTVGWMEWNEKNWGCPFDIDDRIVCNAGVVSFTVTDSVPEAFFINLSKQHPGLRADVQWRKEGWMETGEFSVIDGNINRKRSA